MSDFTDPAPRFVPTGGRPPRIIRWSWFRREFEPRSRFVAGRSVEITNDVVIDLVLDQPADTGAAVSLGLWVGEHLVPSSERTSSPTRLRFVESEPEELTEGAPLRLGWVGDGSTSPPAGRESKALRWGSIDPG